MAANVVLNFNQCTFRTGLLLFLSGAALLSTITLFTAGFLIRPLGAFLFGWMGVTLSGTGLGTGAIGLIPTYELIGLTAAFLLFCLRMIQGLCLGGEYGGAITYVAEHVPVSTRIF